MLRLAVAVSAFTVSAVLFVAAASGAHQLLPLLYSSDFARWWPLIMGFIIGVGAIGHRLRDPNAGD